MRDYGKEGIQHFYFMMLQKDEVCLSCLFFSRALNAAPHVVHRRDQKGRDWTIREPQLQSQLLRRKMDHWGPSANGDLCEAGYTEGRGADV